MVSSSSKSCSLVYWLSESIFSVKSIIFWQHFSISLRFDCRTFKDLTSNANSIICCFVVGGGGGSDADILNIVVVILLDAAFIVIFSFVLSDEFSRFSDFDFIKSAMLLIVFIACWVMCKELRFILYLACKCYLGMTGDPPDLIITLPDPESVTRTDECTSTVLSFPDI